MSPSASEQKPHNTVSLQGLKRKAHSIQDAELPPNPSRLWISPTIETARSNGVVHSESEARDRTIAASPIDVEGSRVNDASISRTPSPVRESTRDGQTLRPTVRSGNPNDVGVASSDAVEIAHAYNESARGGEKLNTLIPPKVPASEKHFGTGHLAELDTRHLLGAVAKVEAMFVREKWNLVAEAMKLAGTAQYPGQLLEREYERYMRGTYNSAYSEEQDSPLRVFASGKLAEVARSDAAHVKEAQYGNLARSKNPDSGNTITPDSAILPTGQNSSTTRPGHQDRSPAVPQIPQDPTVITPRPSTGEYHSQKLDASPFGVLRNPRDLQYSPQAMPRNVDARMAEQSTRAAYTPFPGIHHIGLRQPSAQKPLPYEKPTEGTGQQSAAPHQEPSPNAPLDPSRTGLDTSVRSQQAPVPRPQTFIPRKHVDAMVKHRTSDEANYHKSWQAIAQECGIEASLADISAAVRDASIPSILYTSKGAPIFLENPTAPAATLDNQTYRSPDASVEPPAPSSPAPDLLAPKAARLRKGSGFVPVNTPAERNETPKAAEKVDSDVLRLGRKTHLPKDLVMFLEDEFEKDRAPSKDYKYELARNLNIDYVKLNNWYKNRRMKGNTVARLASLQDTEACLASLAHVAANSSIKQHTSNVITSSIDPQHAHSTNQEPPSAIQKPQPSSSAGFQAPQASPMNSVHTNTATPPPTSSPRKSQTPDSHTKRSEAMKAAWAKRAANGTNGRGGRPPKYSTYLTHHPTSNTLTGSSPIVFAAQILAAAEAERMEERSLSPTPGEGTQAPSPPLSQDEQRAGTAKRRGIWTKRNVSGLGAMQLQSPLEMRADEGADEGGYRDEDDSEGGEGARIVKGEV